MRLCSSNADLMLVGFFTLKKLSKYIDFQFQPLIFPLRRGEKIKLISD